jgi:rod shape-determining protein MreD
MGKVIIANSFRFILLVLIQVLILNNINLGGYINPYLYVYFILLLPFETPGWSLLVFSFLIGFSIDYLSATPGMHAFASVMTAFFRPIVLRSITTSKELEPGIKPSLFNFGFRWFLTYAAILTMVHHTSLFFIEVFRIKSLFPAFERAILSTLLTLILIIIFQYLFSFPSVKKRG